MWPDVLTSLETHLSPLEMALRLLLAAIFSAVIGFEWEFDSQDAGLRTHMLTSLAAATFTIITFEIVQDANTFGSNANVDPIRVIEAP